MPTIKGMVDLISKLESPYITIHEERCVLVRNRNADCLRCAQVCTSGCIHYNGETLEINPEKCIGCGTCATVCPTCAIEAHHPNDAEFANSCAAASQALGGTSVVIACGKILDKAYGRYDTDKVVRVECLGRVEESILTLLASHNVNDIVLVHDSCTNCEHKSGWDMLQKVNETQQQLLRAWHSPAKIRCASKLPGKVFLDKASQAYDKGKRAFFEAGKKEGMRVGAIVTDHTVREAFDDLPEHGSSEKPYLTKVMDDGTLPHFVPDRRERLLDCLARMGEPDGAPVKTRLWGHVNIDTELCNSCRMCATFCPTGALMNFDDEDGSFGVEHYPGDCVQCRCCENICPVQAITVSDEIAALDMMGGKVERFEMKPLKVKLNSPHTVWHKMEDMTLTYQVYER